MRKVILQSFRALVFFTILMGVFYPVAVTLVAQGLFSNRANGSLLKKDGKIIGSELLAQNFKAPDVFWARPSAGDYGTVPGGASNFGPTSQKLKDRVAESLKSLELTPESNDKPYDLILMSGSGLDPHITPESARFQVNRIALARKMETKPLLELIESMTEKPTLGIMGRPRVNVLKLNLALEKLGG